MNRFYINILIFGLFFLFKINMLADIKMGCTNFGLRRCEMEWEGWYKNFVDSARRSLQAAKGLTDSKEDDHTSIKIRPIILIVEIVLGDPIDRFGLKVNEFVLVIVSVNGENKLRLLSRSLYETSLSWRYFDYPAGLPIKELTRDNKPSVSDLVSSNGIDMTDVLLFLDAHDCLPPKVPLARQKIIEFLIIHNENEPIRGLPDSEKKLTAIINEFYK